MINTLLLSLAICHPQGTINDGTTFTVFTGGATADGASFYVKATTPDSPNGGSYMAGTYAGGPKAYFMCYAGVATGAAPSGSMGSMVSGVPSPPAPKPGGMGPLSDSSSYQLTIYLCGLYQGAQANLPTTINYSSGTLEQSSATSNQTGASASASTSRTSVSVSGNQNRTSSQVPAFATGTLGRSAWQQNPDGSYSFNYYIGTQNVNAQAYVPQAPPYASASASALVIFGVPTVTASH